MRFRLAIQAGLRDPRQALQAFSEVDERRVIACSHRTSARHTETLALEPQGNQLPRLYQERRCAANIKGMPNLTFGECGRVRLEKTTVDNVRFQTRNYFFLIKSKFELLNFRKTHPFTVSSLV